MSYYPILVDLKGKEVIVVGGGDVAQRKIEALLESGASVKVISRDLNPGLEKYLAEEHISLISREFREEDLESAFLVIAATDDKDLNSMISRFARKRNILVNAVDQPEDCSFIVPAVVRRGDLVIAVSTSGSSPAMAKRIRQEIDQQFGKEYADFLILMGKIRKEVLALGFSHEENSRIFHEIVDSSLFEAISRKDLHAAAKMLERILKREISDQDILNYLRAE